MAEKRRRNAFGKTRSAWLVKAVSVSGGTLEHHGILGQKWGKRNGPPYPLGGGQYTETEKEKIREQRDKDKHSFYNKKHFDEVLEKGTTVTTLSYNKDRTKNTDMYYAVHDKGDATLYNALFNKPIPKPVTDEDGNVVGTETFLKYKITNEALTDVKVASEDSSVEAFKELYSKDRDFYNFVTDEGRMRELFVDSKYMYRAYREARAALQRIDAGETPSDKDLKVIYRMFNYVIPSDGGGNARAGKDIATQRAKLFTELKKRGYGALLDTNDALYGSYKAKTPTIIFDQSSFVLNTVKETKMSDVVVSRMVLAGRKAIGL